MAKVLLTLVFLSVSTLAPASPGKPLVKEETPGLLVKAKVQPDVALTTARARFPNAKVSAAEIEMEDGKLIYSFDFKTKGKSGIDEVTVDAITGAIITIEHETPKDETKEKGRGH